MECSLCSEEMIDKVFMTCSTQHSFCFKCLLKSVEVNSELKSCPNCRGGDKFIMLTNNINTEINDFYSLNYFKKSLPILQKILNNGVTINTCLISEILLVSYIKNKKQIEVCHKLLELDYKLDDLISLIKWNGKRNLEEIGMEFLGNLATDLFPEVSSYQRPRNEQSNDFQTQSQSPQPQSRHGSGYIFRTLPFT